jgi:aminoglycoside phosphotransferase (APT) family kinase protein
MGDLWPHSLLLRADGLALIDWELATAGYPLQDLAHLHAHLWLLAHQGRSDVVAFGAAIDREVEPWRDADAATHVAAELLMRAIGPFRDPGLDETTRDTAITVALGALRSGEVPALVD